MPKRREPPGEGGSHKKDDVQLEHHPDTEKRGEAQGDARANASKRARIFFVGVS